MKWTSWILFGLAIGVCVALVAMVTRQARRTPAEAFIALQSGIAAGHFDDEMALANLDLVYERALAEGDRALASEVRLARGKALARIGAFERAHAEVLAVHEERGGPREIDDLLIDIEARSGDVRSALRRVDAQLAQHPDDPAGWQLAGRLHGEASAKALERAAAIVRRALVSEDQPAGLLLCDRLSALDPQDPARYALNHRLRGYFTTAQGEDAESVLAALESAATDSQAAREAYTRGLEQRLDPESLRGFVELLERSGHGELVLGLASAADRIPELQEHVALSVQLLDTLVATEHQRFASTVAARWIRRSAQAPSEFYDAACRTLLATETWPALREAANRLFTEAGAEPRVYFYLGLGQIEAPQADRATFEAGRLNLLALFLNRNAPAPVPGAHARAWRAAAKASRALGEAQAEREQLIGALDLEPDFDGELWLRLAELQLESPNAGYRDPETRIARAMRLLPRRVPELMPRWREIGERELRAAGVDPQAVRTTDQTQNIWTPPTDASPYELFRLAEVHLEARDGPRARLYARKLLQDLPGFLPALDLALEVARTEEDPRALIELAIERIQAAGGDDRIAGLLRDVPPEAITPRERVALMRGDPERIGRVEVARSLAARDEAPRALALLLAGDAAELSREARLLAARLALEVEGGPRAAELLAGLREPPERFEEHALVLRAEVVRRNAAGLTKALQPFAELEVRRVGDWIALADELLLAGYEPAASALFERLDADPKLRGGEVAIGLLRCALQRRDSFAKEEMFERAQAFETGAAYAACELFDALDGSRFEDLPRCADALAESRLRGTALQRALIALLAERDGAARAALAEVEDAERRAPLWGLVRAVLAERAKETWTPDPSLGDTAAAETALTLHGADRLADPRQALVLALASTLPVGQAWARSRIEELPRKERGTLWRNWMLASLAQAARDLGKQREHLIALVTRHKGFVAAWDAYERLPVAHADAEAARQRVREQRAAAFAPAAGTEGGTEGAPEGGAPAVRVPKLLETAQRARERGELATALEASARAVELAPRSGPAQRERALTLAQAGETADALRASHKSVQLLRGKPDPELVRVHLDLIERSGQLAAAPFTEAELAAHVGSLVQRFPNDPRFVAAMARRDLAAETRNPALGVSRALARLDGFRSEQGKQGLERLAPGSLERWMVLLLALDAERALALAQAERLADPGRYESWLWVARALGASGKLDEALAEFAIVDRLVPHSGVPREILRWSVKRDLKVNELANRIEAVVSSERLEARDAELKLLRCESAWRNGPRGKDAVLDTLPTIEGAFAAGSELEYRWAVLLGSALCARGHAEDLERARGLFERALPQARDGYERDVLRAMIGVTRGPVNVAPAQ